MPSDENPLESFRQAQESVLASLEQIFQKARDYPGARRQLDDLEQRVFAHLKEQAERLIPELEQFFCHDRFSTKKLEFLRYQIRDLRLSTLTFMDQYRQNPNAAAAKNFPLALAQYRKEVISQIQVEEEHLLPLLQKFLAAKTE